MVVLVELLRRCQSHAHCVTIRVSIHVYFHLCFLIFHAFLVLHELPSQKATKVATACGPLGLALLIVGTLGLAAYLIYRSE